MTMARTVRIGLFALLIAMGSLGGDAIAQRGRGGAANAQQNRSAGPPAGGTPLPGDLFTSKKFFLDKQNWFRKPYFKGKTPRPLTRMGREQRVWAMGGCQLERGIFKNR